MSGRRFRRILLLLLVGAAAYWIYRDRPTLPGVVDDLTRPLFGSKAAVKESEHKRVMSEAVPAIHQDAPIAVGRLREDMSESEVKDLLGYPDETRNEGKNRFRWIYRRAQRSILFEKGRVVSIAVL